MGKFAISSFVNLVSQLISYIIAFGFTLIFTRLLPVEDYGYLQMLVLFGTVVPLIFSPFTESAVSYYVASAKKKDISKYIIISFINSVFFSLVIIIFVIVSSKILANVFSKDISYLQSIHLLLILSIIHIVSSFFMFTIRSILLGLNLVISRSIFILLNRFFFLGGALIGYFIGYSFFSVYLGIIFSSVLSLVIMIFFLLYKIKPFFTFSPIYKNDFLKIFDYGLRSFPISLGTKVNDWSDSFLIAALLGPVSFAVYSLAYTIFETIRVIPRMAFDPLYSFFVKSYNKKNINSIKKTVFLFLKIFFPLMSIIIVNFILFGDYFFSFFYSEDFSLAYLIVVFFMVLVLFSPFSIFSMILMSMNKPEKYSKIIIVSAIFNLIFNIILIPLFGIFGAVLATQITMLYFYIRAYLVVRGEMGLTLPYVLIIICFIVSLISYLFKYFGLWYVPFIFSNFYLCVLLYPHMKNYLGRFIIK